MEYRYNPNGFAKGNPLKELIRVDRINRNKRCIASFGVSLPSTPSVTPTVYIQIKARDTGRKIKYPANLERGVWGKIVMAAQESKQQQRQLL